MLGRQVLPTQLSRDVRLCRTLAVRNMLGQCAAHARGPRKAEVLGHSVEGRSQPIPLNVAERQWDKVARTDLARAVDLKVRKPCPTAERVRTFKVGE